MIKTGTVYLTVEVPMEWDIEEDGTEPPEGVLVGWAIDDLRGGGGMIVDSEVVHD